MERVDKVTAFVTRDTAAGRELLVFLHPYGSPDAAPFGEPGPDTAGVQLPAGTVEPGESPESGVLREVREETGVSQLTDVRKLGSVSGVTPGQVVLTTHVDLGGQVGRGVAVDKVGERTGEIEVRYGNTRRWVRRDLTTTDVVRHFFHLRADGEKRERWTQHADGWDFECYWTPIDEANLIRGQDRWLDLVRTDLLQ